MSKKSFTGGLNSLLGEGTPENKKDITPIGKEGLTIETAKAFLEELSKLTDEPERPKRGRPKTVFKDITKSSQEGTKENETRATFILNEELLEKLKAIAYWDRVLIKEVVNSALQDAVSRYEKKNGDIKPIPKK